MQQHRERPVRGGRHGKGPRQPVRVAAQQPPGFGQRGAPAEEVLGARLADAAQRTGLMGAAGNDLARQPAPSA
eukprot:6526089-Lingulodinium_polyedra.AAC.1